MAASPVAAPVTATQSTSSATPTDSESTNRSKEETLKRYRVYMLYGSVTAYGSVLCYAVWCFENVYYVTSVCCDYNMVIHAILM